ncbi:unnamed protein product [Trichogramma brassicae]|uniref:Uncharacterized protein n=1 Tax=Trichogramma brassicae TaxID=86971 RepID=A0A6H5IGT5_9HYME|nr:unnamed protein product [Trichogramma brassicae]
MYQNVQCYAWLAATGDNSVALEHQGSELGQLALAPPNPITADNHHQHHIQTTTSNKLQRHGEKRVTFREHPVELAQSSSDSCDVCFSTYFVVDPYEQRTPSAHQQQEEEEEEEDGFRPSQNCQQHSPYQEEEEVHQEVVQHEPGCAIAVAMDKDASGNPRVAGCYRAYEGLKNTNNGNTSSLKRPNNVTVGPGIDHVPSCKAVQMQTGQVRCLCFGGAPEKASRHSFLKGFLINLAICALLVLYTLVGSFIFLYLERSEESPDHQMLAATIPGSGRVNIKNSTWLNRSCWDSNDDPRARPQRSLVARDRSPLLAPPSRKPTLLTHSDVIDTQPLRKGRRALAAQLGSRCLSRTHSMYRQRAQVAARSYIHIHTSSTLVSPARLKSLPAYASAHTYSLFFLSFCGALKLQPASTRPRRGHRVTYPSPKPYYLQVRLVYLHDNQPARQLQHQLQLLSPLSFTQTHMIGLHIMTRIQRYL